MHGESTHPPFLGPCEVCGRINRSYRALSVHLQKRPDDEHAALRDRWHAWRDEYRANLRCRKCGGLFEVTDKRRKDSKRCPRCEGLRLSLSKRAYEALRFDKAPDPRTYSKCGGSKARWPVGYTPKVGWVEGGPLYTQVERLLEGGGGIRDVVRLGIPMSTAKALVVALLGGETEYSHWVRTRQVATIHANREASRTDSGLERELVQQLRAVGIEPCGRNEWSTVEVDGQKVRREADLKVAVGDGRKVIVLCDGLAFHGPGCLYGDPQAKIASDQATALAFFALGYSVLRYSGEEIREGLALAHIQGCLERLKTHQQVYRNWCPAEEVVR